MIASRICLAVLLALGCAAQDTAPKPNDPKTEPLQTAPAPVPETSANPAETPASDAKATIYVYRYKQFVGSALEPSVYCDDIQLARMDNGRYFVVKVTPGKHMIRSNDKQAGLEVEFKSGQDYYVRIEIATGMMKGHGRVILVAPEQGAYEVKKLKPLGEDKIVDKTLVVPGAKLGM